MANLVIICPRCYAQNPKLIDKKKKIYRCTNCIDYTFTKRDVIKHYEDLVQKAKNRTRVIGHIKKELKVKKKEQRVKRLEENSK